MKCTCFTDSHCIVVNVIGSQNFINVVDGLKALRLKKVHRVFASKVLVYSLLSLQFLQQPYIFPLAITDPCTDKILS